MAGHLLAKEFLEALEPPISQSSRDKLLHALQTTGQGLATLARLDADALKELGISSPLERASLLAAAADGTVMAPAPTASPAGPVVVEVKMGFTQISAIDTVNQSFSCRFFLDLIWEDPRLIGATSVPDGTWYPKGVYVLNALGELTIAAYAKPILLDSTTGRVLWAQDVQGVMLNTMNLQEFPFDSGTLEIYVHQAETANRHEYVLRPAGGGYNGYRKVNDEDASEREARSVQTFFDVGRDVDEWHIGGFSIEAYEMVGGNSIEYSTLHVYLHVARRWQYYGYKIVLPLCISTAFCLTAFLYDADDLANRNGTSVTMFLATSALLYVVASVLPKTSYLTAIDLFVVQTLFVQFAIGIWSWMLYGFVGGRLNDEMQRTADLLVFLVLVCIYVLCVIAFFWRPLVEGLCTERGTDRHLGARSSAMPNESSSLSGRQAAAAADGGWQARFHRFEKGKNVWPKKRVGEKPSNMLKPHWGHVGDLRA